jgi:endogenous inhibitor of DNA gyrase (YacG/DUF329 family)
MRTYDCPRCGREIEVEPGDKLLFCPDCGKLLEVDHDAEFVDGSWRDLTKLVERKTE